MATPIKEFTYLGKTVILLPGIRFSKNELISRLKQMNVQFEDTSKKKKYYADLYENTIKYDVNKVKIFERLLKDTFHYNNMKGRKISLNQSNQSNISNSFQNDNSKTSDVIQERVINQGDLFNNQNNQNNVMQNKNNQIFTFGNNLFFNSNLSNNEYDNNYNNYNIENNPANNYNNNSQNYNNNNQSYQEQNNNQNNNYNQVQNQMNYNYDYNNNQNMSYN